MPIEWGEVGPPYWSDKPVLVVGCGVSLKGFDFNQLKGLGYILAVKQAWVDLPFADACFGLDQGWTKRCQAELIELARKMPVYISLPKQIDDKLHGLIPAATYLERLRTCEKFTTSPRTIESGGNSGFGAVNLAWLKKARRIYLFGFDYQPKGGHYCPDRYDQPVGHNARYWLNWGGNFDHVKDQIARAGVTVINASINSTLTAFPKVSIEQALLDLHRLRAEGS